MEYSQCRLVVGFRFTDKKIKVMTAKEIIARLRKEIDRMYEDYEGTRMIEEEDAMNGFEEIINDYYEDLNPM